MNVFSQKFDKNRPDPEKCSHCGKMIEAQKHGKYGWLFICSECEVSWEA